MRFSSVDQKNVRFTRHHGLHIPEAHRCRITTHLNLFGIVCTNTHPNDPSVNAVSHINSIRRLIVYALVRYPFSPRFEKATLSQPLRTDHDVQGGVQAQGRPLSPSRLPVQFKHVLPTRPHAASHHLTSHEDAEALPQKNRVIIEFMHNHEDIKALNPHRS